MVAADGRHVLLDRGSLPAAVSASAAIPVVFHPVPVPDRPEGPFIDGGIKCRIGLDLWRQHRYGADAAAAAPAVVHLIGRSSPFSGNDSTNGLGAFRCGGGVVQAAWGQRLAVAGCVLCCRQRGGRRSWPAVPRITCNGARCASSLP